jgi:hypothetical protein
VSFSDEEERIAKRNEEVNSWNKIQGQRQDSDLLWIIYARKFQWFLPGQLDILKRLMEQWQLSMVYQKSKGPRHV